MSWDLCRNRNWRSGGNGEIHKSSLVQTNHLQPQNLRKKCTHMLESNHFGWPFVWNVFNLIFFTTKYDASQNMKFTNLGNMPKLATKKQSLTSLIGVASELKNPTKPACRRGFQCTILNSPRPWKILAYFQPNLKTQWTTTGLQPG